MNSYQTPGEIDQDQSNGSLDGTIPTPKAATPISINITTWKSDFF